MNDRDIDAEFDAIVAHWEDDAPTPPKPRTVQDITAAYAALSRPEADSPSPSDEPADDDAPVAQTPTDRVSAESPTAATTDAPGDAAAPVTGPTVDPAAASAAEPAGGPEVWRQGPSIEDEDDHFEPPPVQLPPGEDIGYWGALVGLVGGPLLLLWVVLTTPFYAGWWTLGAILMFFGGFALLVLRQPKDRDPFDNDNGARV